MSSSSRSKNRKVDFWQVHRELQDYQRDLFTGLSTGPTIIPRPKHCISRKNIDKEALKVLYRLKDKGYLAYLVGGSVRDLLLGKRPKDFDIGTDATPEEIKRLFKYSRIIGKRFRLVHVYFRGGKIIEVSTFRRQLEMDDREAMREGLGPESIFGTPKEDAFRRDLTINGLFYNISDFSVIDFVGGIEDLKEGVIRTIGNPDRRFIRDPVRMMRAIRHAARTGFRIEDGTWQAICQHGKHIRLCAVPRVRDEWLKDIRSGVSSIWAGYMMDSGLFQHIFPGLWPYLEKRQEARQYLLAMLREIDSLVMEHGPDTFSDAFYLAALAYPLLHSSAEWHALKPEKVKWPINEVRAMVDGMFYPYDFKKFDRDLLSQLLAGQWPIEICAERGRWQKRVCNKPTFAEAICLFNCLRRAVKGPEIALPGKAAKIKPGNGKITRKRKYHCKNRNRKNKKGNHHKNNPSDGGKIE